MMTMREIWECLLAAIGLTPIMLLLVFIFALGASAQAVTTIWLVDTNDGTDIETLEDGETVYPTMGQASYLSLRAGVSGPVTDVDWSIRLGDRIDHEHTDRGAPFTACGEKGSGEIKSCRRVLGYNGAYVVTANPYNGDVAGHGKTVQFTITNTVRELAEESVTTPKECPRGGTLFKTEDTFDGQRKYYRCSNGAVRVEIERHGEDWKFTEKRTVCKRGEDRVFCRAADGGPQYYPPGEEASDCSPGTVIRMCVEWEDLLCDDNGHCIDAP